MAQPPLNEPESSTAAVTIAPATHADVEPMVGVLSRGMRDNPLHIAAFGTDGNDRERRLHQLFSLRAASEQFLANTMIARRADGTIVGIYNAMPPGSCKPAVGEQLKMIPGLIKLGLGNARRVIGWFATWGKQDLPTPHWHFGPFAVDATLQRQGIGSVMLRHFCARMDELGDDAYLETDKPENLALYEKFGFATIGEMQVLGVTNWRMVRTPGAGA